MHRATLTADAASGFAIQLGHDALRAHALDDRLNMIAIGGNHHIGRFEGHHRADADRFLTDVKMAKSADLAHSINLGAFFFKTAPEDHLIKHLAKKLFIYSFYRL